MWAGCLLQLGGDGRTDRILFWDRAGRRRAWIGVHGRLASRLMAARRPSYLPGERREEREEATCERATTGAGGGGRESWLQAGMIRAAPPLGGLSAEFEGCWTPAAAGQEASVV